MADLVTQSEVLAQLTTLTAGQIAALPAVITAASRAVERYCDRALALDSFEETYYPGRTRTVYLRNYPVQSISRITGGLTEAINIRTVDTTTFSRATVAMTTTGDAPFLTATGITLFSRQSGDDTTTTLDFATYPTIAALNTAINAISGWLAEINPDCATWATADLNIELGARGAHVTVPLYAYDTELAGYDADFTTGRIELGAGWVFGALPMSWVPDTFRFPDRTWGASRRYGGVRISYQAGFTNSPNDVKLAAIYTIKAMLDLVPSPGVFAMEKYASGSTVYSYQFSGGASPVPMAAQKLLSSYRRMTV